MEVYELKYTHQIDMTVDNFVNKCRISKTASSQQAYVERII